MYEDRPVGIELPPDRGDEGDGDRARDQGRLGLERRQARQDGDRPHRPGARLHLRGRRDPDRHRDAAPTSSASTSRSRRHVRARARPAPAGSRSSPAACSAARARSSSAACAAPRSRGRRCRSSSRGSTRATREAEIVSHSDMKMPSQVVEPAARDPGARSPPDTEVVGIDEGQFFDATLVEVADALANRGLRVIVAGLDQDYRGRPFEPMPQLMAVAEYVDKTLAICMRCGAPGQPLAAPGARDRPGGGGRRRRVRGALPALLPPRRGEGRVAPGGPHPARRGRRARAAARSCGRRSRSRR